ncbi:unnamed protein product, partial [Rotaria magnacalcarata]
KAANESFDDEDDDDESEDVNDTISSWTDFDSKLKCKGFDDDDDSVILFKLVCLELFIEGFSLGVK